MKLAVSTTDSSPTESLNRRRLQHIQTYRKHPECAMIQDGARTVQTRYAPGDPLHSEVELGLGYGMKVPVGVHRALGGLHDFPNPGDILCSALAACADSTLRQIAGQLDVEITKLTITVAGDVDLRGTLCVSRETPVGFQQMNVRVDLELAPGTMPKLEAKLLAAAEHCCVVLQTLRNGVPVTVELNDTDSRGQS
ncbi:MAG: OsmC family peroxiredoxin [Deltaproteobacteria bacterium]|jgi:uncharacterized OsmC-like protein|nr:OsmC family protein [Deltaproteobacteria bacterium]RLB48094.1 MAG: OsmC family peroxiredoxin [Deltaproteobacteria bacterium]